MKQYPSFSIVVPAYNEEDLIASCISSLKQQDYKGAFEIIVVNNASTDRTREIALSTGIRVVDEPRQGYVHALRAGFSAATGDIIACTDADTMVPAFWLSKHLSNLSIPGVVASSGTFLFHDGPSLLRLTGKVAGHLNYHFAGANAAVWRSAYVASGGLNPKVNMGADVELGLRLKRLGKLVIDRDLYVWTSGRRFQYAFFQTLWLYYLNDFGLHFFNRPVFYNFPNIRKPRFSAVHSQSILARFAVAALAILCFLWVTENNENRLFGSVLAHGQQSQPLVALTFDDGPSAYTRQILDTLSKYGVKATFFVVGKNVERHPDIARRIALEGHTLGNHTYSHPFWGPLEPPNKIQKELDAAATAIRNASGVSPEYFRPPHGWRSPWMMSLAHKEHYTVVTWTVSPDDWQHLNAKTIEQRVLSKTGGGAIILLHDGMETKLNPQRLSTVQSLPGIINGLKSRGYSFVTIPELISKSQDIFPRTMAHYSPSASLEE
ncbi:MAG TPA: polysaccharide deacetylase family protein [Chitinivibrionales bacterium]|nr:polysaccharide deacetylase family protein [Chitinivibrionales bacterium]